MMDVQDLLDIAMGHRTAMADAMIVACFQRAHELGVVLSVSRMRERPGEALDWERMVSGNRDTRGMHC